MNKKFKILTFLLAAGTLLSLLVITKSSMAQTPKLGQVFMRGHYAHSNVSRGGDLFTGGIPAFGTEGVNDRDGYGIANDVNILVTPKDPFFGHEIWGEVGLEYSRFGDNDRAENLPSALEKVLGLPLKGLSNKSSEKSEIAVTIFNVYIGPKWRFKFGEATEGKLFDINRLHPYIGSAMMFGVISPPSDDVTYIDIGALVWAGFDYVLPYLGNLFSLGADYRHHFFGNATGNDIDYGSAGVFFTVNF